MGRGRGQGGRGGGARAALSRQEVLVEHSGQRQQSAVVVPVATTASDNTHKQRWSNHGYSKGGWRRPRNFTRWLADFACA